MLQGDTSNESKNKIKSMWGPIDMVVKHNVAWTHKAILGGVNRMRITYDQLTLSQWVQGFCCNILDKQDNDRRERMISYMSDLMEDTTDFSWQRAKAAHTVLCCELERGTVTWDQTDRIGCIRRAHAQKHANFLSKSWIKSCDSHKPWFCKPFQNGT